MFKGRDGILLFIVICIGVFIAFLFFRSRGDSQSQEAAAIPLDLQTFIPTSWEVQSTPQVTCDFDHDEADERLIIYRYDASTLTPPLATEPSTFAPFGGVIFDTQTDTSPEQPGNSAPYQASTIVPYRLLPDFYPDKGQGYLGETGVEIRYFPEVKEGDPCKVTEINIFGFGGTSLPTRLSILRWMDKASGYQGEHFAGNARIESDVQPEGGNQITQVTTYNDLLNHRSLLCDVDGYKRTDAEGVRFDPDTSKKTIDFCFGIPDDPVDPEGVVVALLRGANPTLNLPTHYLLDNATVAPELAVLRETKREPINLVSVGNPSSVQPDPNNGAWCSADQVNTATPGTLWCGRERLHVETRIVLEGVVRQAIWTLISVTAVLPDAEPYWRVEEVELS
jgi:hypothetical protein